jgi:hypothetical protein
MPDALIVDNEPFLASKAADIAAAGLPAISDGREFTVAACSSPTAPASSTSFAAPEAIYRPHPEGSSACGSSD